MHQEISSQRQKNLKIIHVALFTALIAVGAFIKIPVPYLDYFTLQFFFVILSGMLLGSKLGALSVGIYVIMGLIGIPIFAAGGGLGYVLRPSFGFLLGFIVAAFVCGKICEIFKHKKYYHYLIAALGGFIATYSLGLLYKYFILNVYLNQIVPWFIVVISAFPLDIPGDLLLCILAALTGLKLEKLNVGRINTNK
ncbi:MAG: biotin transporter BioY [Clostridiales bacterium]